MQRTILLCLAILLLGLASCRPGAWQPTDQVLSDGMPTATTYPTLEPTLTPIVGSTTVADTMITAAVPSPSGVLSPTIPPSTSEGSNTTLACESSAGVYTRCSDSLLNIEFEYPTAWGPIKTSLRRGLDAGFLYVYRFMSHSHEFGVQAGGLSRDFLEGRGATITDFKGFGGKSGEQICAEMNKTVCDVIQSNVIVTFLFPYSELFCDPHPGLVYTPMGLVEIDLPREETVHGFVFAASILSNDLQEELDSVLGISQGEATQCEQEHRARYDAKIRALIAGIESNTLDQETSQAIAQLIHLAESIKVR